MSWRELRFKDFVTLQRGFDLPKSSMAGGVVPVLGSNCVIGFHNEAKVEAPGVVTGRSGTLGLVQYSRQPFWPHNTALWVKDFKANNPRFVFYKLQTLHLERFNGGVSVPTLNRNILNRLPVKIPDQAEQIRIASILSAYDDLIENNRRRIQLLEQAARLLYREWFVHLRFPGHEHTTITDGVPEGWERKTYSDLFSFLGGFGFKSKTYQTEGKFGIVTIKNVHDARFIPECPSRLDNVPEKMKEHCVLNTGDVLLSLTGNVGRACIVFGENYLLNQRVAKVVGNAGIPRSFTYWTFSNEATQKELENLAYGVAQLNLSPVKLGEREFLNPPSVLLELFGEIADSIFQQITTLNLEIRQAIQARDLLLPRLMNGEVTIVSSK